MQLAERNKTQFCKRDGLESTGDWAVSLCQYLSLGFVYPLNGKALQQAKATANGQYIIPTLCPKTHPIPFIVHYF